MDRDSDEGGGGIMKTQKEMELEIEIDALRAINAGLVEEGGSADQSIVALEKRIATLTAEIAQWRRVVVAHVEEIAEMREILAHADEVYHLGNPSQVHDIIHATLYAKKEEGNE